MIEMLQKKGITIVARTNKQDLTPEEDGYIGRFSPDDNLDIICSIRTQGNLMPICFSVDGGKNITLMKDTSGDPLQLRVFKKRVPVYNVGMGITTTKYATNNLRLTIFHRVGKFEIWEIAITSQDGLFFLTEQMVYQSQFFRDDNDQPFCPEFEEKWPQLVRLLRPLMEGKKLLPLSSYIPAPAPKKEAFRHQQGRVLWWGLAIQMGAIVLEKGQTARVHWKNIHTNNKNRLRSLAAGQLVSFELLINTSKESKTDFVLEARGVTPL